jgi:hypothetical protein
VVADQGNTAGGTPPPAFEPPPHTLMPQPPYEAGPPQGPWPMPGHPGAGGPYGPPPVDGPPTRTMTVLITLFFGLLGLIPAYLDGKKAEQRGVSPGRYYAAFGIALAVHAVVWTAVVFTVFFSATDSSESGFGSTDSGPFGEAPAPPGPTTDDFVADWRGSIVGGGDRRGELSLQMGQDGGELLGGVHYDALGCSGLWTEVYRDAHTVTVEESIEHDPDLNCASGATRVLQIDASGQLLVEGGGWTAVLN